MYMYICVCSVAKTIKSRRSFSELFKYLLNSNNIKKGFGLHECLGILKEDKEGRLIEKNNKWEGLLLNSLENGR